MSSSLSYTVRNNNNVVEETFSTEDVPHSCPTNGGDVSVTSGEYETPLPFETEDDFTDVTLVVEERPLHTNRSLLAFASPVFACMFTSEFRERTERVSSIYTDTYTVAYNSWILTIWLKDARSVSFRSELFTSYILTMIFKRRNLLP